MCSAQNGGKHYLGYQNFEHVQQGSCDGGGVRQESGGRSREFGLSVDFAAPEESTCTNLQGIKSAHLCQEM
eukprot:CAMPEP_0114312232 /NCGR_PEP_ID=MMETSP0059-20121206/20307_1 /TAXON_ID=36894 /ORGANISM="Pyramimonas parkeae, Strain CCMP726" /LENGTH=70 /DNA_ID=CAMNT_0001436577 /DNA_START=71 /DNA_END=280 /DNA_ORIENTATION=-